MGETRISTNQSKCTVMVASRGQQVWLFVVQLAAAVLLGLALFWAETPAPAFQLLLVFTALALIVVTCVPAWRRGGIAGILGGLAVATACWLAAGKTLPEIKYIDSFTFMNVPMLAPIAVAAVLVLAVWGLIARAGLRDQSRFGIAALAGSLLITLASLVFLAFYARLGMKNIVESYQLAELYATAWLYGSALWLGNAGVRPAARLNFQPLLLAIMLFGFFMYWQIHAK